MKKRAVIHTIIICLSLALIAGCSADAPEPTRDPHEGMVEVPDGAGGYMWVELQEGVEAAAFSPEEFSELNGRIVYTGEEYTALSGIDVSFYQGDIDWAAVKADGIDFALVRAGYRGWSEGGLFEDESFRANMDGALAAGLQVGAYFFSQAVSAEEATEEAEYLLTLLEGYDTALPVFFDWERIDGGGARTDETDGKTVTDCALAFCRTVTVGGREPGVYLYRKLGYTVYDLARLGELPLWVGAIGESWPDFYYAHEMWQYSVAGSVAGIEGEVDMNLWLVKNETAGEY